MSLRSRLRPWHGLLLLVFLVGTAVSLRRSDAPVTLVPLLGHVVSGLFGAVVFQFTVGSVWGYAVEYRNAGGRWSDLPFLAPFAVGLLAAAVGFVAVGPATTAGSPTVYDSLAAAASLGFWAFVIAAGLTAVAVWIVVGYRDSQPAR